MRQIKRIIIHCSATKPKQDIGVKEIRDWHVNDNKWSDVGYHYIIRLNGEIETGRHISKVGSHCRGKNSTSIGICLVGGLDKDGKPRNTFSKNQFRTLKELVLSIKKQYKEATVHGHNEFSTKSCPCFSVKDWLLTFKKKHVIKKEKRSWLSWLAFWK